MAKFTEVLQFLRPDGGYVAIGETYEGIEFVNAEPFTKKEFENAFAEVDLAIAKAEADALAAKEAAQAKLSALGLTVDDLKALGIG